MIVHHLRRSQSERVVWLCEELGLDYELKGYDRDSKTILAPADYKALHPMQVAPVIQDDDVLLGESGAVVDYILGKYGKGRLQHGPSHPGYAEYLFWFHFSNGSLQPLMGRNMMFHRLAVPDDNPFKVAQIGRLKRALEHMNERLATHDFLAGDFTAADIMSVFSLTTMRIFAPLDLSPYAHIRTWLKRLGERPAYRRAMEKGDPGFAPMLE